MFAHEVHLPVAIGPARVRPPNPAGTPASDSDVEVSIPEVEPYFTQQTSVHTCWAAALATLLKYLEYPTSEASLMFKYLDLQRRGCDTQGLIRLKCSKSHLDAQRQAIARVGLSALPGWTKLDYEDTVIKNSFDAIDYLIDGLPFVLLKLTSEGLGHAFVVTGASYSISEGGKRLIDSLQVLDPSDKLPIRRTIAAGDLTGTVEVIAVSPRHRPHQTSLRNQ